MILAKLQTWALRVVAVLAVLVGAYALGGRTAKKAALRDRELEDAKRAAAGAKGAYDAQVQVRRLPSGGARDELNRDWVRDDE